MKRPRQITTIKNYNFAFPKNKTGHLVVYRRRFVRADGAYIYLVEFQPGNEPAIRYSGVGGALYREWLRYYSRFYPFVEIYHGEISCSFDDLTVNSITAIPGSQTWRGYMWQQRGKIFRGHQATGSFDQVVSETLAYTSLPLITFSIRGQLFTAPATMEDIMALVIEQSEVFSEMM